MSPQVQFGHVEPDPRNSGISSIAINFSEPVTGFELRDLYLGQGVTGQNMLTSAQTLTTTDNMRWVLGNLSTVTSGEGIYGLILRSNLSGIQDRAGNYLAVGDVEIWTVDRTRPSIIALTPLSTSSGVVGSVAVSFSETMRGVALSNFTLSRDGGPNLLTSSQTLSGSASQYTLGNLGNLTSVAGRYRLTFNGGTNATDQAGNTVQAPVTIEWGTDNTPPTVAMSHVTPDPRANSIPSLTITFSEPVRGFEISDLRLTRNGGANLITTAQTLTTSDQKTWTLSNLNALTAEAGTYSLVLVASGTGITDVQGNPLSVGASETWSVTPLQGDLTVKVGRHLPLTTSSPIDSIVIEFSHPVNGFDVTDMLLYSDDARNLLNSSHTLTTTDNRTWTLGNLSSVTAAPGTYIVLVKPTGTGITNALGESPITGYARGWKMENGAPVVTIESVNPKRRAVPVDTVTITFSEPVTGLTIDDLLLEGLHDERGNLLTDAQTLTTTDGIRWTLGNLRGVTSAPGKYILRLFGGASRGIVDGSGVPLEGISEISFTVLPWMFPSNKFLRMMVSPGHHVWDHDRFTNFSWEDGHSLVTIGTRIRFSSDLVPNPGGDPLYNADADVWAGLSGNLEAVDAAEAYRQLYAKYEAAHPETITGSYVSAVSLKDRSLMLKSGDWPPDAQLVDNFAGLPINPPSGTAPNNVGFLDLRDAAARERLYAEHLKLILGQGPRPRQDIAFFDEVGYVHTYWPAYVDLFSRLKQAANEHGVLIGLNLGGWGWTDPFQIVSPNVIQELATMTNMVTIESIWSREPRAAGGTFRTVENTQKITSNLRKAMDLGLAVGLMPVSYGANNNEFSILNMTEVWHDGEKKLLLTLPRQHHVFPHGGSLWERFGLHKLPAGYQGLEGRNWTAVEVAGRPDQVMLYDRYRSLDQIKADRGISGTIDVAGGQFVDYQASTRMTAAFAMMVRRPQDRIFVSQGPGHRPGGGDPNNIDNWWYWPELLGAPKGDYVIASSNQGVEVLHMYRHFENGTIEIFPQEGWVRVKLLSATTGTFTYAAPPVLLASVGVAEAATSASAQSLAWMHSLQEAAPAPLVSPLDPYALDSDQAVAVVKEIEIGQATAARPPARDEATDELFAGWDLADFLELRQSLGPEFP